MPVTPKITFVVDADLPRSSIGLIRGFGYEAVDVRDVGLGSASDADIAAYSRATGKCLITGDFGFADIRNYPPSQFAGLVVVGVPRGANAQLILGLIASLLRNPDLVGCLFGRLAIIESKGIRLRPPCP